MKMKKLFTKVLGLSLLVVTANSFAQTAGTLSFSYTPVSHTGYSNTKNVLAIWIQDANGNFVKTKFRYAGNGTKDHLATWSVNAGGTASNCLSANCNVVGATTGATLTTFQTKSFTWDGLDANGTLVADGTYKVTIQSTWDHGSAGTATRSFTWTKGATADAPTFANDNNFTSINLTWTPASGAGVEENTLAGVKVYPVPSATGLITVEYQNASEINVYDTKGTLVKQQVIENTNGTTELDLTSFENGTYLVLVTDGKLTSKQSVVIAK